MNNKALARELLALAQLLTAKDNIPSDRPTERGLGKAPPSKRLKDRTKRTLNKVKGKSKAKDLEKVARQRSKLYLGNLGKVLRESVQDLVSSYKDNPEIAKLVWVALAASLKQGANAIVKRQVAPVDDWQIKPEEVAKHARVAGMLEVLAAPSLSSASETLVNAMENYMEAAMAETDDVNAAAEMLRDEANGVIDNLTSRG